MRESTIVIVLFCLVLFTCGVCVGTGSKDDARNVDEKAAVKRGSETVVVDTTDTPVKTSTVEKLEEERPDSAEVRRKVEALQQRFPYTMVYRSDIMKNVIHPCIEIAFDEGFIPLPNDSYGRIIFMSEMNKNPQWEASIEGMITEVAQFETEEERTLAYLVGLKSCVEGFRQNAD